MLVQLQSKTIHQFLFENARSIPHHCACYFNDSQLRLTWEHLYQEVKTLAKGFLSLGVQKGQHVGIWATNVPGWYLSQLACGVIGAPLVTLNPEWKVSEMEYALSQSDTAYLVMIEGFNKKSKKRDFSYDYLSILSQVDPSKITQLSKIILINKDPQTQMRAKREIKKDVVSFASLKANASEVLDQEFERVTQKVSPQDLCMIQYTSGTTGFPKGVMLSHYNVLNNALVTVAHMRLTKSDRLCGPVPDYHCFGSILVNLCGLVSGAEIVIPFPYFDVHRTLEVIAKEECTALHGVPTMFYEELEEWDFNQLKTSHLRTGIIAGAPCPRELMKSIIEKMGAREITIGYGLTEASPITHQTSPSDSLETRVNTVGRVIEHTEAKIVDPNTLESLGVNEIGEIWVRGFHVMKGYYKNPEETKKAIHDGWLRTGDLGAVDELGYYRIVGRIKEMFIAGGHNVYPAEVEQFLLTLFEKEIEMIKLVGVPHPKLQEVAAAAIILNRNQKLTKEEFLARCEDKLEWPKIPKYILFVEDFKNVMTVTGKIQKFKLKKLIMEKFSIMDNPY